MAEYTVDLSWDDEKRVWYAVCDDIPIALESNSFDALIERVKIAAPEILELNNLPRPACLYFKTIRKEFIA